jgi:hypothetical protein
MLAAYADQITLSVGSSENFEGACNVLEHIQVVNINDKY